MHSPRHVFQKIRQKLRYGLMMKVVLDRFAMMGLQILPFYLVEERLSEEVAPAFEKGFEDLEIVPLGPEEMETVARVRDHEFSREELLERLKRGNQCLGVKQDGALAAFTWADLSECTSEWWRFPLKDNEAYLFDAYTLEAFRGRGIAPYMRYACYMALNRMGRDRFYSVSEVFNAPSLRFKERLRARLLSLWVSVQLFRRYRWTWKLKDCKGKEIVTRASKRSPLSNRPSRES
jgi:ribosomal protein S18 acetylase RimI-like enzyme